MEKYLERCLDSVRLNSYKNLEIICVNDGSTDSSLSILRKYESIDSRFVIIDQKNQKLSAARNAGIEVAKGKWISLVDSDDWVHHDFFETLITAANETNADIAICEAIITSERMEKDAPVDRTNTWYKIITKAQLNKYHVARSRVWGKLYRRDIIGDLRFISGAEPVEDNCFNTTLYSTKMTYCMVVPKLYYYFMRADSAVHLNTGRQSLVFPEHMIPILSRETDPEKRQDMIKRCYNILFAARYSEMYSKDYKIIKEKIKNYLSVLSHNLKYLSPKDRMIYYVLSCSPALYRAWRIHDDPTLLEYEKKLKKQVNSN